jgi:hypothetical protein
MSSVQIPQRIKYTSWRDEALALYNANLGPCLTVGALCLLSIAPYIVYWVSFGVQLYTNAPIDGLIRLVQARQDYTLLFFLLNMFTGALVYPLGVKCVQKGKVEMSDIWPGSNVYASVILYIFCEYVVSALIQNVPIMQSRQIKGLLIVIFINPLIILGYAHVSDGCSVLEALRKSFKSAISAYWKFLWLNLI